MKKRTLPAKAPPAQEPPAKEPPTEEPAAEEPQAKGPPAKEAPAREPPAKAPIKLKLGPLEVEGPLGLVAWLLVGLLVGVGLGLYVVIQHRQPSFLIDPMISRAVSATMAARPTATPVPTPAPPTSLRILDDAGNTLRPERGEYKLHPGQRVGIQVVPGSEGKKYLWTSYPPSEFDPEMPTGPRATLTLPETLDQLVLISVCELDESLNCPSGREYTVLVRAATR